MSSFERKIVVGRESVLMVLKTVEHQHCSLSGFCIERKTGCRRLVSDQIPNESLRDHDGPQQVRPPRGYPPQSAGATSQKDNPPGRWVRRQSRFLNAGITSPNVVPALRKRSCLRHAGRCFSFATTTCYLSLISHRQYCPRK